MKKLIKIVLLASIPISLAAFIFSGFYSGWPFRAPHAFGYGSVKICIAETYQLTELDPTYNLTRPQALAKIHEAASIWNEATGCTMIRHDANGDLKIALRHPSSIPPEYREHIGLYMPRTHKIDIYETSSDLLVELIAHELGHSIDLDHVSEGVMQQGLTRNGQRYPNPSEADRAELQRNYPLLR